MEFNADLASVFIISVGNCIGRYILPIEIYTFSEPEKIIFYQGTVQKDMIDFLPFVFGMSEFSCKISVICKQKYARGCLVKPSDRINPFVTFVSYELKHRMLSMRIFHRRYIILWLIHK